MSKSPVERLMAIAAAEIGYLEKRSNAELDDKTANAGSCNYTKYARDLDAAGFYDGRKNGYPWCDVFVDWCFFTAFGADAALRLLCQPKPSYGAGCTMSASYYRFKGRFFPSGPQVGDQIFFTNDGGKTMCHTGIVVEVTAGRVCTIEGNTSGASGVVPNGGGVCAKSYDIGCARIGGYGRPDFTIVEEEVAMTKQDVIDLVHDQVSKAVSEEFQRLADTVSRAVGEAVEAAKGELRADTAEKVYRSVEELPWGREAVEKLLEAGILHGDQTGALYLTGTTLQVASMLAGLMERLEGGGV